MNTMLEVHASLPCSTAAHSYVDVDMLRTSFAAAMSKMYKEEVPLYGDLVSLVEYINQSVLCQETDLEDLKDGGKRISLERHGAIRLGTAYELRIVHRIFKILGMHSVGYYDLSVAGLPMHAICFRPRDAQSLSRNPFRIFTTLLRPELLQSTKARELALDLVQRRKIFSDTLTNLIEISETQNGRLTHVQACLFVDEALESFRWQSTAAATFDEYNTLKAEHAILADIVCFHTAHINHLTPRVLDIKAAQAAMKCKGMDVKDRIEDPPERKCPILLRQTSFLALHEAVCFPCENNRSGSLVEGYHKARFGEIEERGAAVTPAGRRLYDALFDEAMELSRSSGKNMDDILSQVFVKYPDSWDELRLQGLIYSEFQSTGKPFLQHSQSQESPDSNLLEELIQAGCISATPITYEDFLPFSAAGIFQSNLGQAAQSVMEMKKSFADQAEFEKSLGCSILDDDALYASMQRKSIESCALELGLNPFDLLINLS